MRGLAFILAVFLWASPVFTSAQETLSVERFEKLLKEAQDRPGVVRSNLGVTGKGTTIACVYAKEDLDPHVPKTRILLVAGFQDQSATSKTLAALRWFYTSDEATPLRKKFTLSVVPLLNPDNSPAPTFPPQGDGYNSQENTEAEYLWRWIGMMAPDLVVGVTAGETAGWKTSADENHPAGRLVRAMEKNGAGKLQKSAADSLNSLMNVAACNTGTIPAITAVLDGKDAQPEQFLKVLLKGIEESRFNGPSPARKELQSRVDREPLEIARQLAKVYGHELPSVEYIPALALVGRLWLGDLTNDEAPREDVERIVAPYITGKKTALPEKFSGSHLAGHLIFTELAKAAKDPRQKPHYQSLALTAAGTGFDGQGQLKPAMPAHNEMSDAVFMGCPILAEAGRLTGDQKFFSMADKHFQFMRQRVLRADGIYRHSPLCETAWGRGNGFPALGLAWSLSDLPKEHALHEMFLKEFQNHMRALVKHQDPTGMWHQVIDDDSSYREMSCTCMITFAMIRGVRNGWLDEATCRPVIEKAFRAIKTRIATDGTLVDVCTGTGKQKTLRDYYDRKAILGRDARGGAMALIVTTEMARWQPK
jgi:rhamnogalacturonyl hydrolase YesR